MSLLPAGRLFLVAGPCQLEDESLNLRVAETLARLAPQVPGGIIFKASFDKANRSNVDGVRGPGLEEGLRALERVREATGLPLLFATKAFLKAAGGSASPDLLSAQLAGLLITV